MSTSVDQPVFKIITVWLAAVGIASWSDAAAALAAFYSFLLIGEWGWNKIGRPFCERRGWIQRRKRRTSDVDGSC